MSNTANPTLETMTLRDYFAAAALGAHVEAAVLLCEKSGGEQWREGNHVAEACYKIADAMLVARQTVPMPPKTKG